MQDSPFPLSRSEIVFVVLLTIHSSLLVASNAAGSKIIALPGGLGASATVVPYLFSIIILDTIAEIYGRRRASLVVNLGMAAIILSVLFFEFAIWLPPSPYWANQSAFISVLGSTPRILAGGWLAYFVGQHVDRILFLGLKRNAPVARPLWFRAWAAMAVSQALDTVVFIYVAFAGIVPLLPTMAGQYLVKVVIATAAIPLIYATVPFARSVMRNTA